MTLDGYSKHELIHIVDMYNLQIDMDILKKKKGDLLKEMKKVPKKKLVDLPNKSDVKKMVTKDKNNKSSLLNKVTNKSVKKTTKTQKNKITNYTK